MRKQLIIILSLLLLCGLLVGTASASSQGGLHDGVYLIYDADDLTAFAAYVNGDVTHAAQDAKLMGDIDMDGVTWVPIGTSSIMYAGTFDGCGYTIRNVVYNTASYAGIFRYVSSATITSVCICDCMFSASGNYVSCLVCNVGGNLIVNNCSIYDNIMTTSNTAFYCGSIIANSPQSRFVSVSNCSVYNNIISGRSSGGIAGIMYGTISNCYVYNCSGNYGSSDVGGILGKASNTGVLISDCAVYGGNLGNIICGSTSLNPQITNCYSAQSVTSETIHTQGFWDGTGVSGTTYLSWNFADTWYWDNADNLPKLQVSRHVIPPQITAVTLTSSTPAPLTSAVTATVTATGTGTLSYAWHYSTDSGSTWTAISGQTTDALTFTPAAAGTYTLKCVVTDTGGSTDSYEAGFTGVIAVIVAPPVITSTPVATPAQGPLTQTVVLSIDTTGISGEGTLTYQWQEQLNSVWTNMPGSSSTVPYSASVTDAAAAVHTYRLVVSNAGGSTTSASVTYTSYAAPVFSSVSVGPTTSAVPATITFTATASDATSIVYQLSSNEITWSEITSPYVINQVGTYYFRAFATGYGGTTYSESQTITVSDLIPVITSATASPTSGLVPFSVTFSANATNSPTYTWYKRANGLDQQIGTGNPFVYQFTAGTAAGVQYFRVKAHNQYGDAFSPDISVTVGALPGTVITSPSSGSSYMQRQSITFTASSSSQFATTYSWVFSDGGTASGSSVTHTFQDYGAASATVAGTNQFGTDTATVQLEIFEYSAVAVSVSDISAKGATFTGLIGESVIDPTTTMHFEIMSKSGTVLWKTDDKLYSQSTAFTAEGMPLISGQQYRVKAVTNNYGNSQVISFTLNNASRTAPTPLGTVYESSGLNRDPFNITKLVDGSTAAFGEALGGGTVGKALCFGVIVLFLVVGLWLRQGDVIIPVTIGLAGGWFIIGNLPGEWQPIAYSLLVVSIVAIFWVIFKKRIE